MVDSAQATIDSVSQKLANVADLMQKAEQRSTSDKAEMRQYVETLVKEALQQRASRGAGAGMEFDLGQLSSEKQIIARMPGELQSQMDNAFLLGKIMGRPVSETKYWQEQIKPKMGEFQKALATASGKGTEWVPTDFSNQLYEFVRAETRVANLYPNVNMPTPSYTLPIQVGRIQTYSHAEQTADTGQTLTTLGDPSAYAGNVTLVAKAHVGAVLVSKDVEEDSIVDVLPLAQSDIITGLAEGREDCIMNGDTTGTHMDADVTVATDRRKMWIGLRKEALANSNTTDLSTWTETTIHGLRGRMGVFGVNPNALAWVVGIQGYIRLMALGAVMTLEKYGPNATILSGELGKLFGIPVIVSEWVREDLDVTGVYSTAGQTQTVLHLVHRRGHVVGVRRGAEIQVLRELYARSRQDAIQVTERVAFSRTYDPATRKHSWMGYNIGL